MSRDPVSGSREFKRRLSAPPVGVTRAQVGASPPSRWFVAVPSRSTQGCCMSTAQTRRSGRAPWWPDDGKDRVTQVQLTPKVIAGANCGACK